MITRRRTTTTLAAAALTLALAACSSGGDGGGGADADGGMDLSDKMVGAMEDFGVGTSFQATEPLEFGLMYRDHPNYPINEQWSIFEHLADERNVSFTFQSVPLSDWGQKRSLLISSGEAADLIPSTYIGDAQALTSGGALLPVSDYLEYLPNFSDKIEKWGLQENLDRTRAADGKFYVLPGLHEQPKPQYSIAIRSDLWEAAGLEDPTTWDEFAEQLEIIQEQNPDLQYPYTERWNNDGPLGGTLQAASGNFGTEAGWGFGDGVIWDGEQYVYTAAQDEYKDLVTYFAGLVSDGLLDPEGITQDDDPAIAKFATGRVAAIATNDQNLLTEYRNGLEQSGVDGTVKQLVVPAGPAGNMMDAGTGGQFESGIAISSKAADRDDFVALLQYVDWLYFSDEGLEFAKWGVEGETFTTDGSGTRILDPGITFQGINPDAEENLQVDYGYANGVFMLNHGATSDLVQSTLRDEVVEFIEGMNEKDVAEEGPAIALDEMQVEESALLRTNLQDLVQTATSQFLLGSRPLDEWDAFVGELESAGMEQYVQIMNEAAGTAAE